MKDYDSTLARMAGNIAAGVVAAHSENVNSPEFVAKTSFDIAKRIIAKCAADYAKLPVDTEQAMQGERS